MAQTMLLMSGVSMHTVDLKRHPLLQFQIQKSKPKFCSSSSNPFFSPLPSLPTSSSSASSTFVTRALFKSKTKVPPAKKVEQPKPRVEDGIFGTSGGIGFTKQNELFVGRVAMLGFAGNMRPEERGDLDARVWDQDKFLKFLDTIPLTLAAFLALFLLYYAPTSLGETTDTQKGASLFSQSCVGCHDGGGNIIQPGATLSDGDLKRNGADTEEEIYRITYYGKGRMPGFGVKCMPRGQCTFGSRLHEDEIKLLAQFVKLRADQGWATME